MSPAILFAIVGLCLIFCSIFIYLKNRSIHKRVFELKECLYQIMQGGTLELKPDSSQDSFSELLQLFVTMHQKMESARIELEEKNHKLHLSNLTLEEKYAQAYTLQLIQDEISRELDRNELLKKTLDILLGVFGSKRCMIYMVDDDERLVLKASSGAINNQLSETVISLKSNHPYAKACIDRHVLSDYDREGNAGSTYSVIVPLNGRHSCLGVMIMEHENLRVVNQDLIDFARLIAQELSLSLENAYLYDKMRKMAIHDALTGAYNRMYLMNYMAELFAQNPSTVSVAIFDLDHFKRVNDQYGHLAGDMVLKTTAALAKDILPTGILARYGGEEFVILLPEVAPELAYDIVENVRCIVAEHQYVNEDGIRIPVTLSAGLAAYPQISNSFEELLKLADEALYRAKNSGRNQVCVAGK